MKATKKQLAQALALMDEHGQAKIFLNDKGRFFFSLRGAAISVDSDPDRILVLEKKDLEVVADEEEDSLEDSTPVEKKTGKNKEGKKGKAATPEVPATPAGVGAEGAKPDATPGIPAVTDGGTKSDETPAAAGDGSTSNAVV